MISWLLTNALTALLIPPGFLFIVLAAGLTLRRRLPRTSRGLVIAGTASLYLLSMPLTGSFLLQQWETPHVTAPESAPAQAIVVLGGGRYPVAPEYGGDTVSSATLVRLRYAAQLHRETGLPLLVSGGSPDGSKINEAELMAQALEQSFRVPVRWREGHSANTLENARLSRETLAQENIRRIYLVTHAWHMPRSVLVFERAGFEVIPATTAHATGETAKLTALDFLPNFTGLRDSSIFFHETIGMVWYRLRLLAQA
ncbi:MAG: YdcF family protein [Burkholderiales bacterium]